MKQAYRGKVGAVLATLALMAGGALAQSAGTGSGTDGGAGVGSSGSAGGTSASTRSAQSGRLVAADRNFLMRAAGSGLAELEAARMAADKAQDEAVKRYAAMLVEQHEAANKELSTLAESKGLSLPTSAPAGKRRELNRLGREKGEDFDAAFVQTVGVREHRQDVRLFREASRNAKDPEVKAWAAKMLPTLEQHLSQAQALPAAKRPLKKDNSDHSVS